VTRDLDEEERRDGRSGSDFGTGLSGMASAGSISDYVRRDFSPVFPLLSPARPKSRGSKIRLARRPSRFSNAVRPRPVGTPVRWERAVHREARSNNNFYFAFLRGGSIFRYRFRDNNIISVVIIAQAGGGYGN
jgi:hypothetical protein